MKEIIMNDRDGLLRNHSINSAQKKLRKPISAIQKNGPKYIFLHATQLLEDIFIDCSYNLISF